jgi:hypothetical protein
MIDFEDVVWFSILLFDLSVDLISLKTDKMLQNS